MGAILFTLRRLCAALVLTSAFAAAASSEPVFSFDSTPGKLPKNVVPRHYAIDLKLDLASLTTVGTETVDVELREPTARLTLNAVNTAITEASVDNGAGRADVAQHAEGQVDQVGPVVTPGLDDCLVILLFGHVLTSGPRVRLCLEGRRTTAECDAVTFWPAVPSCPVTSFREGP